MKTFPRPPDGLLQAVGAAKRRPMAKAFENIPLSKAFVFLLCFGAQPGH